jgi:hypothetical protein
MRLHHLLCASRRWLTGRRSASRERPASAKHTPLNLEQLEDRALPSASVGDTFVATLYQGLLGRPAESQGLAFWSGQLNAGASPEQVAGGILGSDEFRSREVQILYQTLLGRTVETGGLGFWFQALKAGASLDQVKAGILGSDEFFRLAGASTEGYLNAVFRVELGRSLDPTGRSFFGTELANGVTTTRVAAQVVGSVEAERVKVTGLYQDLLGRGPDAAGADFWTGALLRGGRDEALIARFLGSAEFQNQLQAAVSQSSSSDPNAVALQFIVTTNKFGTNLPGVQELVRTFVTDPSAIPPPPPNPVVVTPQVVPVVVPEFVVAPDFVPFVDVSPPVFVDTSFDFGFDPGFDSGFDFGFDPSFDPGFDSGFDGSNC